MVYCLIQLRSTGNDISSTVSRWRTRTKLGTAPTALGLVTDKIAKKYKREMKQNELSQRNKIKPMRVRETEHMQGTRSGECVGQQ